MNYNFHTHTYRCRHASGTEEEYVLRAIEGGIRYMGFSDHAPLQFADGHESTFRVPVGQLQDYFDTIGALRDKYRDQIDIRIGFEMEYYPTMFEDMLRFVKNAGYRGLVIEAFGLGGLHYIRRNLVKAMEELGESGIYVLVVSQCLYEKADVSVYEVGRGLMKDYIINGRDMTTEAAVCKMMWALAQEEPTKWLKHQLVGEFR